MSHVLFHGPLPYLLLLFILYLGTLSARPSVTLVAEVGLFITALLTGIFLLVLVVSLLIAQICLIYDYCHGRDGEAKKSDRQREKVKADMVTKKTDRGP